MDIPIFKRHIESVIKIRSEITSNITYKQNLALFKNKNILLYGAGAFGREIFSDLKNNNIEVFAFLDKNAKVNQKLFNKPVYLPEDSMVDTAFRKNAAVILSIVLIRNIREEIISFLHKLGYENIIDAQTLRAMRVPYSHGDTEPDINKLLSEKNDILKVPDLLADEHSIDIYLSVLQAHFKRDYQNTIESINSIQYFSPCISRNMRLNRFIDCGAYTGDTLASLALFCNIDAYAGFEPGQASFKKLVKKANEFKNNAFYCLFPCATGRHLKTQRFNDVAGSGAFNSNGENIVQVVSLDNVLKNFNPTIIKMDIEGEEFNTLLGAKEMISASRPDLAICVYHNIADYWRIPNLINSWDLGYKFYLRSHSSATMETVLYAIIEI